MSKFIPNSYQKPNMYCDDLMYLLTGEEYKVLDYAVRRIFGFQKRADRISLTQFCTGTRSEDGNHLDHGTGLSRGTVIKAIEHLTKANLLTQISENNRKNEGAEYGLMLESDNVNFAYLEEVHASRQQKSSQRIEKANTTKADKLKAASPTDELPSSPMDEPRQSNGRTGGSPSDEPLASPMDEPGVVHPTNSQNTDRNPEEIQGESQPPSLRENISLVWQEIFGEGITIHAQETLAAKVTDLGIFRATCLIWKTNEYRTRNLTGLMERYEEELSRANQAMANSLKVCAPPPPAPPGLSPSERKQWVLDYYKNQPKAA